MNTYQKIEGKGTIGDFVLNGQTLATDAGFSHVSKIWYDKTMTYGDAHNLIAGDRALSRDILCQASDFSPTIKDDGLCFEYKPEKLFYKPTEHALKQACGKLGISHSYPYQLFQRAKKDRYATDILRHIFSQEWLYLQDKMIDRSKTVKKDGTRSKLADRQNFLFRVRKDGTMRAMLSEIYAVINNEWLLDCMQELIPGGRVSHWRGDSDTMQFNVLVPDSLRSEDDSDYGGMVSSVNSEIGTLRHDVWPSVFRSICMNGCIWDQTKGIAITQVHKGEIDLAEYKKEIQECVRKQLDLLPQWTDIVIGTKKLTTAVDALPLLAQIVLDNKLAKAEAKLLITGYNEELAVYDAAKGSLFGLVNAVTRAGQKLGFDAYTWDIIGGKMASFDAKKWDNFTERAKHLDKTAVDNALAIAVA